ncbi:EamA family transporter [Candidatus Woesearchaeota archaeon]|nr:EamA family transporter [Candidatus Woesearchaeota archaeon]
MVNALFVVGVVALLTVLVAFGALFFKLGSAKFSLNVFQQLRNYKLMLGVFFYMLPMPFYLWALKNADLAIVFPINALTYVWVALLSQKFLGERMNRFKWLGIAAIVIGVAAIGYSAA